MHNPHRICRFFLLVLSITVTSHSSGQDKRTRYPSFIAGKAFVEVTAGYVNFPFSDQNLMPGFTTEKITNPKIGVKLAILGFQFNEYLSAHLSYMRPVSWVYYNNVNNDHVKHTVTINLSSLLLRGRFPITKKIWAYGEGGFSLLTRSGFYVGAPHVLPNANYGTLTLGGGLQYRLNKKWSLVGSVGWTPEKKEEQQPKSLSITGGFNYHIHQLPDEKIAAVKTTTHRFPKYIIQGGYTTNVLGYGVNHFFANNVIPVFWSGEVEVKQGASLHFQRNFFHTRKVFSIDWGASLGYWKSREQGQEFYTASLYPLFRFTFLRKKKIDAFFNYSVVGPTYISKTYLDSVETGKKFTFQDFMGAGVQIGKDKRLNAELRIMHFSNGDLFPKNNGVKIPLSFMLGYSFDK